MKKLLLLFLAVLVCGPSPASAGDLSGLTEITSPVDADLMYLVDVSEPEGQNPPVRSKKITIANLKILFAGSDWSDPVDASIVPGTDDTYDLGSAAMQFKDGYFDGTLEADTLTEGGVGVLNSTELAAAYQPLEATLTDIADGTIAEDLVNTASPWADDEVANTITASNYLPLAGGVLTGEATVDNLGLEFTAGDDHSNCSAFSATGGGIFFDDSEGVFKKCQDNVLTTLDTGGGGGYTNLTEFVAQNNWKVFYSNGSGDVTELALGADGTYLKSNGASADPTFATPSGGATSGDSFTFTDNDADPNAAGELLYDNTVTDWDDGALAWYDDDEVKYIPSIAAANFTATDNYVLAYDADTDKWFTKVDNSAGSPTLDTVGDPTADKAFSINGYEVEWWSSHDTGTREYVHLMYDTDTDKTNQTSILMIGTADTDDAEVDFIQAGDGDPQGTFNENFVVNSDGSIWTETTVEGASVIHTPANASPDEGGELVYDNTRTGQLRGGLVWHDGTSLRPLVDIANSEGSLESGDDGHVVTYHWDSGNGYFDLTSVSGSSTTFYAEDGDGTEVAVTNANEWKFVEGAGIDIDWTDVDPGSDADPFDLTFAIATTQVINAINPSGAMTIGDGGDTLAIDTSDWDISTTGAMTGVSGNISLWTNDSGYTTTTDQVGTLTSGDLCTNNGTTVECTVNTEAELETALDATNVIVSTEIDSAAELETLANLGAAFSDYADDATVSAVLVTLGLTATASEINTPLDGALVTLTEFRELETIGDTVISANQWAAVGGMPETVTGTELGYVDGLSEALSTSLSAKAPLASPTFTGVVTVPTASAPTTDADGEMSFDQDVWVATYDMLEIFNGVTSAYVVATSAADTPSNGQVPKWNTDGTITWENDADSAGTPTAITVADTTDTSSYVALFESATGDLGPKTDAGITYNAGTGVLTATGFSGPLTGAVTGNVTGDCSGNAGTATLASTVTAADTTDTTSYVALFESATGSLGVKTDAGITYNAGTGVLTATGFSGPLTGAVTGNASTASDLSGCTDCLNATEIEDIYLLDDGDVATGVFDFGGVTTFEIWNSTSDMTLGAAGEIGINVTDDQLVFHGGAAGEIQGEAALTLLKHVSIAFDPAGYYDQETTYRALPIMTVGDDAPEGITITEWRMNYVSGNPTTEFAGDLICDTTPDYNRAAGATVMDAIDTTDGASTADTGFDSATCANASKIYIDIDSDPTDANVMVIFEMWYYAEED